MLSPHAGIEHGRVGPRGRLHVGQRGQRLVVHLDQLAAVLGHRAAAGQHHGHDLAHVARLVPAQRELVGLLHGDGHAGGQAGRDRAEERQRLHPALEIGEGEHVGHAGQPPGRVGADGRDARVRVRAAHEGDVEHPGQLDVVHEAALAAEVAGVFLASDRCSEVLGAHASLGGSCLLLLPFTALLSDAGAQKWPPHSPSRRTTVSALSQPPKYAFLTWSFCIRSLAGPSRVMRPVSMT